MVKHEAHEANRQMCVPGLSAWSLLLGLSLRDLNLFDLAQPPPP